MTLFLNDNQRKCLQEWLQNKLLTCLKKKKTVTPDKVLKLCNSQENTHSGQRKFTDKGKVELEEIEK